MERVYSLARVPSDSIGGPPAFLAGSESDGPILSFSPPHYEPKVVATHPGGFISLATFKHQGERFVLAATKFFPGFDAAECDIHVFPLDRGEDVSSVHSFSMPYTHRVAVVEIGGENYFVGSTLCAKKDSKEDWTQPGGIFIARIPNPIDSDWDIIPVLEGLNKNHGMDLARIESGGQRGFLVSALEGCFFLEIPDSAQGKWNTTQIDSDESSDAFAFDWDGTGQPQVFSIQPFHGHQVHVHRRDGDQWEKRLLTDQIEFGHILWAGNLLGRRALVVGWRRGARDLVVYWKTGPDPKDYEIETIDREIGPAQMIVHPDGDRDFLIVSGHGAACVLLYELTL